MVTASTSGRHLRSCGLAVALMAGAAAVPAIAQTRCDGLLPADPTVARTIGAGGRSAQTELRPITPGDLIRLRDFGPADGASTEAPGPLAISPDGTEAAFILTRADPLENRYCRALVALSLDGKGPANLKAGKGRKIRMIAPAGDYIFQRFPFYGTQIADGFNVVVTPRWSPDGQSILFLRRDGNREDGKVQVWLVRRDGNGARALTHSDADVEAAAWSADGKRVIYTVRAASAEKLQDILAEGRRGWLYDERILPTHGPVPQLPLQPLVTRSVSVDGGDDRPADTSEHVVEQDSSLGATAPDGRVATVTHRNGNPYASLELSVTTSPRASGESSTVACRHASCDGDFLGVWWAPVAHDLLFLRREGWNKETTALYRWSGNSGSAPVAILKTDDVLLGCLLARGRLVCTRENATTPRRIAQIDTQSGRMSDLFDPNPEFQAISLGRVERLRWRNDLGLEAWGDLALPPGYRSGTRLPMVVVQYNSRGFLRGGTGDEYPIFALAARGIAVLSIERPPSVASLHPDIRTPEQLLNAYHRNWAERRSIQSAIEVGVKAAVDRGIADPARLGITGLSDGASAARWALINSDLFKVAAVSTCCVDENALIYNGLAVQRQFEAMGYAAPDSEDRTFWKPYSLAMNAHRMNRPLLMQLADEEYLAGVNTLAVLKAAGQPIEMFVFPGEHHKKWQPAHRAAAYERNIDWFTFWLQDKEDPDPAKRSQYARWEEMRDHPRSRP